MGKRLDRAALEREQLRRLRAMLEPVLRSNVFYREKLGAAGLEAAPDLTSMDAYRQLPRRTNWPRQFRSPPYGTLPTFPPEHYIQEHHTSGTTGQGLCWLDDAEGWAWFGRCWAKVFRAAGVTAADRVFFPFSFGPFLGTWSGVEGARHLGCLILAGRRHVRVDAIRAWRPTVLVSTPTHALRMAEVAAEAGGPGRLRVADQHPRRRTGREPAQRRGRGWRTRSAPGCSTTRAPPRWARGGSSARPGKASTSTRASSSSR